MDWFTAQSVVIVFAQFFFNEDFSPRGEGQISSDCVAFATTAAATAAMSRAPAILICTTGQSMASSSRMMPS